MKGNWNSEEVQDLENYSNAGGCFWILNKDRKKACLDAQNMSTQAQAQADLKIAEAIANKSTQKEESLSPMAITGIIVGSLMAITVMVVVIKKVKSKKG